MANEALIIVDVQNDFCEGGGLAVPGADEIVPTINRLMDRFDLIIASLDYHPENHSSFKTWPPHCVGGTRGAELHEGLRRESIKHFVKKATSPEKDAYSAFEDTNLSSLLKSSGVEVVYVCGLATDYCVKATVLDALKEGLIVYVISDAIRAVSQDTGEEVIKEMEEGGARFVRSRELRDEG